MVVCLKSKVRFCEEVGPDIAKRMSRALQGLLDQPVEVEFRGVESFRQQSILLETTQKCFGSFSRFSDSAGNIRGVVTVFFPLSSTKALTELLIRRYFASRKKEIAGPEMKLSAFQEAANILMSTHIAGIADALNLRLHHSIPKLVHFAHLELLRHKFLANPSDAEDSASIGQFSIKGASNTTGARRLSIKGRFIIAF